MSAPILTGERSMTAKVLPMRPRFHPQPSPSRKRRLAHDLCRSEAWIDKAIYGANAINVQYAKVIESDLRAGDHDAVALWIAPGAAAEMGEDIPDLADAWREYDEADTAEDAAEAPLNHRAITSLTGDELDAYARRVAKELWCGCRFLARLRLEQARRKA